MFAVLWCRRPCSISQTALGAICIVKNIGPFWKRPIVTGRQIGGTMLATPERAIQFQSGPTSIYAEGEIHSTP